MANEGAMNRAPKEPTGVIRARFIAPSPVDGRDVVGQIVPSAADDEVAAIVAALAMREEGHLPPGPVTPISRWALAGRRRAMRGIAVGPTSGWGRPRRGTHG